MGVSACGKSAVGRALASAVGFDLIEGDDHHGAANLSKLASGTALTDEDRQPWLLALAQLLAERGSAGRSTVLACSSLRRSYRDLLRQRLPKDSLFFVHLDAPFEVASKRASTRTGHFMPVSLLRSQFETLEPLQADEGGVTLDATGSLEAVLARALEACRERLTSA